MSEPSGRRDEVNVVRWALALAALLGALGSIQGFLIGPLAARVTQLEDKQHVDLQRVQRFRDQRLEEDRATNERIDSFMHEDVERLVRLEEGLAQCLARLDILEGVHPR